MSIQTNEDSDSGVPTARSSLVAGDFVLGGSDSPVAVCTLATQSLLPLLQGRPEIAIAGRVYTENVGIEKMVQNLLALPNLRYLLICGRESRHRVGQAILSLHRNGSDPVTHRIRGATGPEPVLPNLSLEQVEAFQKRFQTIDLVGEQDSALIIARAQQCLDGGTGVVEQSSRRAETGAESPVIRAEPESTSEWTYDPRGFFLIHVDRDRRLLLVEHYGQDRLLLHRLEGETAAAVSHTAVRLGLIGEMSHAAYLGRELAKAEAALRLGLQYQQDSPLRAPETSNHN